VADDLRGAPTHVDLRPATADDRDFLLSVYASTRAREMAIVSWPDAQKAAFVAMQFEAQDRAYRSTFPDARFLIVTSGATAVGRLCVAPLPDEIRVVDLTLLPDYRGMGIGSILLAEIIAESEVAALPVRLHVEHGNRARRLYERFGFVTVSADDVYEMMERPPSTAATAS
jgi:ribosomal protein S18 acetylase RimI-like enzyme